MQRAIIFQTMILALNILGFYSINERSHPELEWKQLETENVIIVYHEPLQSYALKTAYIGESSYKNLSKSYDIELEKKVKIYISDQDDITNGYCMMSDHIVIWVGENDFVSHFTGNEKWLRKVIGHEMSHYFMHSCLKSWLDIFIPYSALSSPAELTEGYAMYFSGEEWGYGRSDAELRRGVFDDNLSMRDKRGYHYTVSFAKVRYLAHFHGEEKLRELLKYRNFMGLYNFNKAFNEVYGKSYEEFRDEWRRHVYTYYYGKAYDDRNLIDSDSESNAYSINGIEKLEVQWHNISEIAVEGDKIVIFGKKYDNQKYRDLTFGVLNRDSLKQKKLILDNPKELLKTGRIMNLDLSPNGMYTVYSRYQRAEHGSIRKVIYRIDNRSGEKRKIGRGGLARASDSGDVYYHYYSSGGSRFMLKKVSGEAAEILKLCDNCQVGDFVINREKNKLCYSLFDEENRFFLLIHNIKTRETEYRSETNHIARDLIWQGNVIYFALESDDAHKKRFFAFEPESQKIVEYTTPVFNITAAEIKPIEERRLQLMAMAEIYKLEETLGLVQLKPLRKSDKIKKEDIETNFYNSWMRGVNEHQIDSDPEPNEIIAEGTYHSIRHISSLYAVPLFFTKGFTLSTWLMDPLLEHKVIATAYSEYDFDTDKSWYYISYTNNTFSPSLTFSTSQYDWPSDIYDEKIYYQRIRSHRFKASFPVDFITNPFSRLDYSLGLKYTDLDLDADQPDDQFENGSDLSATAEVSFRYNLPVTNSYIHPVKHLEINYSFEGANEAAGMNNSFIRNRGSVRLGYAPFYESSGGDEITLINKTIYLWQNGRQFYQLRPCIDSYENIPIAGLFENRTYIRGNEKRLFGDELFSNNLELWLKFHPGIINDLLPVVAQISYLGAGSFLDYSFITDGERKTTIKTYGLEIKAALDLFGINTVHRLGRAYNLDNGEYLDTYYQAAIPLLF
ncbi:MAG: hypothetical protein GF417_08790 [Candidatus Latescibacteria bacterium]|nr:hypothetical protein [Candidatus Latescibacterota bacterium]